jgi:chemotaxis protein CheX
MSVAHAPSPHLLLDHYLINTLSESVIHVMQNIAQTAVTPQTPEIHQLMQPRGDIFGIVRLDSRDFKGTFQISLPKKTALIILENMLGEVHDDINPSVSDAVGELTNMIYGTLKTNLNKVGYQFDMALPTVNRTILAEYANTPCLILSIPFRLNNQEQFFVELTSF